MKRRFWVWTALILFTALVCRLGSAAVWNRYAAEDSDTAFFFGDSDSYWQLGRALAEGTPYEHDPVRHWKIFRMPGYPALLAPLFRITPDPPVFWARLENVFLGILTVLLTGLTARTLLHDDRAALFAMAAAAVSPELLFQSVCVLSEELFCAVNLLLTLTLIRFRRTCFAPGWGICVGFLAAAAVYVRPDWLYWLPFLAIGLLFCSRSAVRICFSYRLRLFCSAVLAAAVFAVLLAPWWIRNAKLTGHFVPTTLQMGASLYDGLSPTADGSSDMSFVDTFREEVLRSPNGEYWEMQLDQRMKDESISWAKSHPADVIRLAGVKFIRLWNIFPNESAFSSLPAKLLICVSFTPILVLAAAGLVSLRRCGVMTRILWLPAVYVTLLHLIFVSSLRYRSPILPGLFILAGWGAVQICRCIVSFGGHRENE